MTREGGGTLTHRSSRRRNDGKSERGVWVGDANRARVWGFSPFLRFVGGFGAFLGAFSFFGVQVRDANRV